jgi:hypothetical protein
LPETETFMPRSKINALPQDNVLRAHLRRQAEWPDDAQRLVRRDTAKRKRRDMLDAVDRIGRANRLKAEAEALRASAERAGYAMKPEVADEIERLERRAAELAAPARAKNDARHDRKAGRPHERGRADAMRSRKPAGRP